MSENPDEHQIPDGCTATMNDEDQGVDWADLRRQITAAIRDADLSESDKFTIPATLLLDLFDDARRWAEYEREVRLRPEKAEREIAIDGDGPYLAVIADRHTGLNLYRTTSMRGCIAHGMNHQSEWAWFFEIKRELQWDQMFEESQFGSDEWTGFHGPGRPDPTESATKAA